MIEKVSILSKREMVVNQQTLMEWISIYADEALNHNNFAFKILKTGRPCTPIVLQ